MKHLLIISLCFLPLVVIWVIMKISLLLSSTVSEVNYVREESKHVHGPYVENAYDDIDEQDDGNEDW